MNAGFEVIQGKRVAKNLNTYVACLDALGEFYYNINTRFIPFKIEVLPIFACKFFISKTVDLLFIYLSNAPF